MIPWNGSVWDGGIPCHPLEAIQAVYVEIPKAGCTSVKIALSAFKGGSPDRDIHSWFGYTTAHGVDELYRWFETRWRGFFKFTVVRQPIARFESFYYSLPGATADEVSSFVLEDFSWSGWRTDIHAQPQTHLIGTELERFDFVGRTERMGEVEALLSKKFGRLRIPHANRSRTPRGELSKPARAFLRRVYRQDFEILGYR